MPLTAFLVGAAGNQRDILALNLESEGFDVIAFTEFADARARLYTVKPDLLILDVPVYDPAVLDICKNIKCSDLTKRLPILLLTGRPGEESRNGKHACCVDQHILKPYYVFEVVLQARLLVERSKPVPREDVLEVGNLHVSLREHRATHHSQSIILGPIEFRLLVQLMKRPGYIWTREELLSTVWSGKSSQATNTVEIHICRLRKALCQYGSRDPIRTVRGMGYCIGTDASIP